MPTGARLALPLALCVVAAACSATKADTATTSDSPTAATLATPAAPSTSADEVRQALEAANAKYVDAIERGDSAAVAAFYAADLLLLAPGQPPLRGAAATAALLRDLAPDRRPVEATLSTLDVTVSGDLAVESGTYLWRTHAKGAAEATERGRYLHAWRRQPDGTWKLSRGMFSPDAPPSR
jgi:ketosteroid isomerase-like protein